MGLTLYSVIGHLDPSTSQDNLLVLFPYRDTWIPHCLSLLRSMISAGNLIGKLCEMLGVMVMDYRLSGGFPREMLSLTWHSLWLSILFQRHNCTVNRRYNDFVAFHDMLLSRFPYRLIPTLPPKKLMGGMFRNQKHFPCCWDRSKSLGEQVPSAVSSSPKVSWVFKVHLTPKTFFR